MLSRSPSRSGCAHSRADHATHPLPSRRDRHPDFLSVLGALTLRRTWLASHWPAFLSGRVAGSLVRGLLLINEIDQPGVICLCLCLHCRGSGFSMTELVLKNIGKHFGAPPWLESEKDYIVLNDAGRIIGRIVMRAGSPKGRPWVWTITARGQPPSFYNHGYSETREQAMEDFKAQYRALEFHRLLMPK
jgi:hypothetical protein